MNIFNFLVLGLFFSFMSSCTEVKEEVVEANMRVNTVLPFLSKKKVDKQLTKITSKEELESIINLYYDDIFHKIPSEDLLGLIESVEYSEKGITTFRYDYLENNLSDEDCLKLCKLIFVVEQNSSRAPHQMLDAGISEGGAACPHYSYKCQTIGTCIYDTDKRYICTCNC